MTDETEEASPFHSHSFDDLRELPTVFGNDLFNGRVALVTGGGGAIGTAICTLLGRLGASIVACGRSAEPLETLAERMESIGVPCHTVQASVRDPDAVAEVVDAAWDRFGQLDLVVNNAGGQFSAPALDITPKGWHAVVETNLYGTWYVMQAAARRWIESDSPGSIVNIATILGRASVGIPHTAAARAGAVNLTRSLAVEWAPNHIRVNSIAVGVIASEGLQTYPDTAKPSIGHNPMRRPGDVHDVAQGVAYLASPAASFITGTHLEITGGEHIWGEWWPLGKPDWFKVDE